MSAAMSAAWTAERAAMSVAWWGREEGAVIAAIATMLAVAIAADERAAWAEISDKLVALIEAAPMAQDERA